MNETVLVVALLAVVLGINTVGFRNTVHFLNVGYAFSIIALSVLVSVLFGSRLGLFSALQMTGLLIWGGRLGVFVLRREARPSYQQESKRLQNRYGHAKVPAKLAIWIGVSILYVLMFLPALYHLSGTAQLPTPTTVAVELVGVTLLCGGLLLETKADQQKSAYKALHPREFCGVGLYQWVRCPNYLGEILFWLGGWLMGVPFYSGPWQWLGSLAGLIGIILIMMSSTKRLEAEQESRYGNLPAFQSHVRRTPVLFPFVPIYTLRGLFDSGTPGRQ
mgnify:CR=1 FL=1